MGRFGERAVRSKFFIGFVPSAEPCKSFLRDLKRLLILTDEEVERCLGAYGKLSSSDTPSQQRTSIEEIESLGLTGDEVGSVAAAIGTLLQAMSDPAGNGPIECWSQDLFSLGALNKKEHERFDRVLGILGTSVDNYSLVQLKKQTMTGVIPILVNMFSTVELRAMIGNSYDSGDSVEQYTPKVIGMTPIASVAFRFDAGLQETVTFQIPESYLDVVISKLEAIKKEIAAMKAYRSMEQ